jgi:hypothetical protein
VEADDERREAQNEELLEADAAHVDVDAEERELRAVAADQRAASCLHQEGAVDCKLEKK